MSLDNNGVSRRGISKPRARIIEITMLVGTHHSRMKAFYAQVDGGFLDNHGSVTNFFQVAAIFPGNDGYEKVRDLISKSGYQLS